MWCVYGRWVDTGKETMVNKLFKTQQEAIKFIALTYIVDMENGILGELYYYMKKVRG